MLGMCSLPWFLFFRDRGRNRRGNKREEERREKSEVGLSFYILARATPSCRQAMTGRQNFNSDLSPNPLNDILTCGVPTADRQPVRGEEGLLGTDSAPYPKTLALLR